MSIQIIKTYLRFSDGNFRIEEGERIKIPLYKGDKLLSSQKKGGDIFETEVEIKKEEFPILKIDKYSDFRNKLSLALGYNDHPSQFLHVYGEEISDFSIYGQAYPIELSKKQIMKVFGNRVGNTPIGLLVDPVISLMDSSFVTDVPLINGTKDIYVLSLKDVVTEINKSNDLNEQNKKIVYMNFIAILFPRISKDMFYDLLSNMDMPEFFNKYQKYYPSYQNLSERYSLENKIYQVGNKVEEDRLEELKISVSIVNAKIKNRPVSEYNYNYKLLDIVELFKLIEHDAILSIRLNTSAKNALNNSKAGRALFTKLDQDKKIEALEVIQNNPFKQTDAIEFILVDKRNKDKDYIRITLNERMVFNVEFQINSENKYENFVPEVNRFIKKVNSYGRQIFDSDLRFEIIDSKKLEYFLDIQVTWYKSLSPNNFDDMMKSIYENTHPNFVEIDKTNNKKIYFSKGLIVDTKIIDSTFMVPDYYYDDIRFEEYSDITKGKTIEINYDVSTTTFNLTNFLKSESEIAIKYLEYIISNFIPKIVTQEKPVKLVLKDLKLKDPNLFIMKKFGSNVVYSRKCQKNYQPKAYDPIEYNQLPDNIKAVATKYWNFTNHTDMYYVCPNKKYPYLSFITGMHPKGYCLPCCRKTDKQNIKILTDGKKYTISEYCAKYRIFNADKTEKEKSRYVIHFGKKISPVRLGKLPPLLDSLLNKGLVEQAQSNFSQKIKIDGNTIIIDLDVLTKMIELGKEDRKKITLTYSEFKKMSWKLIDPISTDNEVFDLDNFKHEEFFRENRVSSIPIFYALDDEINIINPTGIINLFYISNAESIVVDVIDLREKPDVFRHRLKYSRTRKSTKKNDEYSFKKTDKFKDLLEEKYYLHGITQKGNLRNIGLINSLATIIGLDTEKMILHLVEKFKKMESDLSEIIDYNNIFRDKADFIRSLLYAMKEDYISQNYDYSLAVKLLFEMVYKINIVTIVYDDGKFSVEDFNLTHLLSAIILKKHNHNLSESRDNIPDFIDDRLIYYPIVNTSIRNFINNSSNLRKIFTNDVAILKHLSSNIFVKSEIFEFVNEVYEKYSIVEDGYNVYFKTADGYYFYKRSKFSKAQLNLIFNLESIIVCLLKYRDWVFSKSRANPRLSDQDVSNYSDPLEKKYVPMHRINRIEKIIIYKDKVHYLYFSANASVFRINPISLDVFTKLSKKYDVVFSLNKDPIKLDYDPDFINALIKKTPLKGGCRQNIVENMTKIWDILDTEKEIYSKIREIIDLEIDKERRYRQILKVMSDKKFNGIPKNILSAAAYDFSLILKADIFREKINIYNNRRGLNLGGQKFYYKLLED